MGSGFARGIAALGIGMQGLATGLRQGEEWKAERDRRQREDQWRADRDALTKQLQADLRDADAPAAPVAPAAPAAVPAAGSPATSEPPEIARYGVNPDAPTTPPAASVADGTTAEAANPQPQPPRVSRLGAMAKFYENLAATDLKHGKLDPQQFAAMSDRAKALRDEGVFDAYQHYISTGDLVGAIDRFDGAGSKRIDRQTVEARKVTDPASGVEVDEIRGKYVDGTPFQFNPTKIAYGLVGPQAWIASQERAAERKARADHDAAEQKRRREKDEKDENFRQQDLAIRAGHLGVAQQEAADRREEKTADRKAREDLAAAVESGDPVKIKSAAARAASRGIKFDGTTQKPDEFSANTSSTGRVTITNKRDGSARIYDKRGALTADIPAPGKGAAPVATKPPQSAIDYLRANPSLRSAFEAKYGAGTASAYLK